MRSQTKQARHDHVHGFAELSAPDLADVKYVGDVRKLRNAS